MLNNFILCNDPFIVSNCFILYCVFSLCYPNDFLALHIYCQEIISPAFRWTLYFEAWYVTIIFHFLCPPG